MSVAKNTIYLTSSYTVQKILAFIYFVFLARLLGPEDVGKYVFAISLAMAFSIFSDLGLTQVFIREVARDQGKLKDYLGNIIGLKLILTVFTFLALVLTIFYFNKPSPMILLVTLAGIAAVFFESFAHLFYGVFRAYQNLRYESWGTILHQVSLMTLGLSILFLRSNLVYLMLAYLLAGFLFFLYPLIYLIKEKIKIRFTLDKKTSIFLFKIALPFALAGLFNRLFSYVDTISLGKLVGDVYVGWYNAAYKLNFGLFFIPAAFSAAIFPAFSSLYYSSREKLVQIFEKSFFYLMIIALPLAFGVIFLARQLILKIYGLDYLPSIFPLQILMVNLIFMFIYTPLGALLNATGQQLKNTLNIGSAALINLILNLILIPVFYQRGLNPASAASFTSVVSNIILFSLGIYFASKIIKYDKIYLFKSFFKSFLAASIMGLAIFNLKSMIPLLPLIFLAGLIYLFVLYLVRGIDKEDFDTLKNLIKKEV